MKMNKGNKKTNRDDMLRYMAGEMSDSERNAFEKELQRDPFAAEAAEGFSLIDPGDARPDLNKLQKKINIRTARRHLVFYSGVAAVMLLFIVSSVIFFRPARELIPLPVTVAEEISGKRDDSLAAAEKAALAPADSVRAKDDSIKLITATGSGQLKKGAPATGVATTKPVEGLKTDTDEIVKLRSKDVSGVMAVERETLIADTLLRAVGIGRTLVVNTVDTALQLQIAEGKNITGFVTDEEGRPFPYVAVYIKGETQTGTITGEDGRFILPVNPDTGITIVANFIGYKQLLVQADKSDLISIRMEPDIAGLDEVIVVGFGEQRKTPVKSAIRAKGRDQTRDKIILTGEITQIIPRDTLQPPHYTHPAPEGGYAAFHDYIRQNIRHPWFEEEAVEMVVEADLPVSRKGTKGPPVVISSPGVLFSSEVIRLLMDGPEWAPALRSGKAVSDTLRIRIVFRKNIRP
ncbi:MAG: carboxypeptidase-like regulatory domain-containing protein [Bacteroidales bacterium]